MVTVTREQNPKPRERQATAARQLWHCPTKERVFLNVNNCLGEIGLCQNIQNSTSFPKKKRVLKAVLLIVRIFISKRSQEAWDIEPTNTN